MPSASANAFIVDAVPIVLQCPGLGAVEHRPAARDDGGQIRRGRRHQQRGRRLVASGRQDDAIERVAVQNFEQREIREVAVERGRRPSARLLDRMARELEWEAAGVADAVAQPPRELDVDAIARREVRASLRDANYWSARL